MENYNDFIPGKYEEIFFFGNRVAKLTILSAISEF